MRSPTLTIAPSAPRYSPTSSGLAGPWTTCLHSRARTSASAPRRSCRLPEIARRAAAREGAELAECDDAWVLGDGDALDRALTNLIENARTHGPPGAPIRVRAERHPGRVHLSVDDGGEGLVGAAAVHA